MSVSWTELCVCVSPKGIRSQICLQISTTLHQADAHGWPSLENKCYRHHNITDA